MKIIQFIKSYFNPKRLIKHKDIRTIVAVAVFVISSFVLASPIGHNKIKTKDELNDNYNYQIFSEFPENEEMNELLSDLLSYECTLRKKKELVCNQNEVLYEKVITYTKNEKTKNIHFVLDIYEYVSINYEPTTQFTTQKLGYDINEEHYLIRFSSHSFYFQAHQFGIEELNSNHEIQVNDISYRSSLKDFELNEENLGDFGTYLLNKINTGYENDLKLDGYIISFSVVVLLSALIIIVFWLIGRKGGIVTKFKEYYNIASVSSLPISIITFILLWFIPSFIIIYPVMLSLYLVFIFGMINSNEEII